MEALRTVGWPNLRHTLPKSGPSTPSFALFLLRNSILGLSRPQPVGTGMAGDRSGERTDGHLWEVKGLSWRNGKSS
jgi:hypothetical protein